MLPGNLRGFVPKKHVKLLVVDENTEYFEQLQECAEMCSHEFKVEIIYSSDEKEATTLIEKEHPTVIVMDAYIPEMNNQNFIEKCHQGVVPVVVTSDFTLPELNDAAERWGAEDYIPKSENPDEVEEALRKIIDLAAPIDMIQ